MLMPIAAQPNFKTAIPVLRLNPNPRPTPILPRIPTARTTVDGVFEGGGGLGTAYLGSLAFLDQAGIWFSRVAGNSAGAITATMVAAGFHSTDIEYLLSNFPGRPPRPPGVPTSLSPIDTFDFLDFPTLNTI